MSEIIKPLTLEDHKNVDKFIYFMKSKAAFKDKETDKYKQRVTHTLMGLLHKEKHAYRGAFSIEGKDYNKFLMLYKAVLGKIPLFIVERPKESGKMVGPLIIDIDYKTSDDDRVYDIEIIKQIIEICNRFFMTYLNIDQNEIIAYVQEKQEPTFDKKNNKYKDGFHVFYDIPLCYNKRKFLFDLIKKEITEQDLFKYIDTDSSYDEIVDEHVLIDNGVLMYGSTKEGRAPYDLTYVFNYCLDEYPLEEYNDEKELVDIFSLQKYSDDEDTKFKKRHGKIEEQLENMVFKREEKAEKLKEKMLNNSKNKNKNTNTNTNTNNNDNSSTNTIDASQLSDEHAMVYELVNIMSKERAAGYESWRNVCWALHNVSPKLYSVFLHFSKKAGSGYDEASCSKFWDQANRNKRGYTIASIKMWAKEDNETEYFKIKYSRIARVIERIETPNDNDLADFIKELYGDVYRCVNISKNIWYEFQDHHWVVVDSGYTLLERIANDVANEFTKGYTYLLEEAKTKNGIQHDNSMKNLGKLFATIGKLKDQKTGTTLVKTCARKMYDRKFEESLDSNPYLIGFDNGVFDLEIGIFRKGAPDDRVTMSTGYNYNSKHPDEDTIDAIEDLIAKIQPEEYMRVYIYLFFASCLDGKNRDQAFRIFTGSGGNGKSVIVKLFELALGEYYGVLPPAVLTMKDRGPDNASPFLAVTRGKRAIAIHETENDASIQLGKMKGITGGDKITARKLFGDPFDFTPQFKLFLVCNKLPKIPSDDGGTWRRIRVTPFESKFVAADKVNKAKHFYLRDTSLDEEKLSQWSQDFMWLLINVYYPKYIKSGLCEPAKVRLFSEKYQKDQDVIFEFLSEGTIDTKDEKDSTKTVELFKQFKEWYRNSHNSKFEYTKRDLEEYLIEKRGFEVIDGTVKGLKSKFGEIF
jgi:Megaviricetes DNA primase